MLHSSLDCLLLPEWLVPVEPAGIVIKNYAIGIRADRIALIPQRHRALKMSCADIRDCPIVYNAGLINARMPHEFISWFSR